MKKVETLEYFRRDSVWRLVSPGSIPRDIVGPVPHYDRPAYVSVIMNVLPDCHRSGSVWVGTHTHVHPPLLLPSPSVPRAR